jgi:hypothetical protein
MSQPLDKKPYRKIDDTTVLRKIGDLRVPKITLARLRDIRLLRETKKKRRAEHLSKLSDIYWKAEQGGF